MVVFGTLLTTINKPMFAASGLVYSAFGATACLYWITFGKIFDRVSKGVREAPSKALIGELEEARVVDRVPRKVELHRAVIRGVLGGTLWAASCGNKGYSGYYMGCIVR